MYILIVEDDYRQAELIEESFRKDPYFASAKFDHIRTESDFRSRFEEIARNPPDAVILDVMLRWMDPVPDMGPPPPEVEREGFWRAGLRNAKMLAQDPRTKGVHRILYTISEDVDFEEMDEQSKPHYLPKDAALDPLVDLVRSLVDSKEP